MNILILNWRDMFHPFRGGAEIVTFKYAEFWASKGHKVYWISNSFPGSKSQESKSKIKFQRIGPFLSGNVFSMLIKYPTFLIKSVYFAIKIIRDNKIDMVIDEIHGLPFFSPLYSKARNVLLVCEVGGEIWDKMWPFPINIVGKILEKFVYFIYRNTEIWAISNNTKKDILTIKPGLKIKILPLGIDIKPMPKVSKYKDPSAVFLGRIVKMKGIESAISATIKIRKKLGNFILYVIGDGNAEYIKSLSAPSYVKFLGRLPDNERNEILARCHFLIHPSYKEGFGLTVLDAGIFGTPTIGRTGSSLTELIDDRKSGLLFIDDNDISKYFLNYYNSTEYNQMKREVIKRSLKYDWRVIFKESKILNI